MDQVYPRDAKALCEVVKQHDGYYEVEVLKPLAGAAGAEKLAIASRRRLEDDERDEKSGKRGKRESYMDRRGKVHVWLAPTEVSDGVEEWQDDR